MSALASFSPAQKIMKPYIEIFSALLTPTIAVITTFIAIQQYRNNRLKQRLDLYERRMAIYKAVTAYISDCVFR
jgi:hypothetical protein